MNKEDMILLDKYLSSQELDDDMIKLRDKVVLINKQIEAQDIIADVQTKLQEMDKAKK